MLHMDEPCHIWMSHVTYEKVMSQMYESCHIWMSHVPSNLTHLKCDMSPVTYVWVMSHTNESSHCWMGHVTYESVTWHMSESCHICMSHVTYEWAMWHMNKSCHIWMSHVTYEWVTYGWVMSHDSTYVWYRVATISRLLNKKVSFAEYSLFYRALLQKRPMFLGSLLIVATSYPSYYVWYALVMSRQWIIHFVLCIHAKESCHMTHQYASHDSTYVWYHSYYVWYASVMSRLDMAHPYVWRDSYL